MVTICNSHSVNDMVCLCSVNLSYLEAPMFALKVLFTILTLKVLFTILTCVQYLCFLCGPRAWRLYNSTVMVSSTKLEGYTGRK